jgi:hypothetical protein
MKHLSIPLLLALAAPVFAQDVSALLKDADRFRMSTAGPSQGAKAPTGRSEHSERGGLVTSDNLQVDTLVQTFNADGTPDKERRYTVFAQAGRQSLVLMQSPAEKGQKVLMLGDDFWLLMPGSQRPLRITPMQKLLGDASTGDIATLSWAGDYTATLAGEEPCATEGAVAEKIQAKNAYGALLNSKVCYRLDLLASRKGVTYQRIELWLGKQRHEPVRANLYVQSDKLAKQARFVMDSATAPTTVTAMVLVDQLSNKKETRVTYLSRKDKTVPAEWLNPMFLARNPQLE